MAKTRTLKVCLTLVCGLVSGCKLLDPRPYNPLQYDASTIAAQGEDDASFSKMTAALLKLANGYAGERDDLMLDTSIWDFGLIGLGAAAVANPVFEGARAATIGLGLATGVGTAGRSYLAPQVRIVAYNNAADGLICAASVSGEMSPLYRTARGRLIDLQTSLNHGLALARASFDKGQKGDVATKLLDAQNAGSAALTQVNAAIGDLDGGVGKLATFALTTVSSTNKTVVTGVQNIDAALKSISALAPSGSKPANGLPGGGQVRSNEFDDGPASDERTKQITEQLNGDAAEAIPLASQVTTAWGRLMSCAPGA